MTSLSFFVAGTPVTQGGMRPVPLGKTGRTVLVTTGGEGLNAWRKKVTDVAQLAANQAHWQTIDGPCRVALRFFMQMPNSRPAAIRQHGIAYRRVTPDIDKLTRAIHDSLKLAKIYEDDARAASTAQEKYEVLDPRCCGVEVIVSTLPTEPTAEMLAALERRMTYAYGNRR